MHSEFQHSPNLSPLNGSQDSALRLNAQTPGSESDALRALKTNDAVALKALIDRGLLNVADGLFDNGQNCLHAAIKLGSLSIALYLAQTSHALPRDLINSRDSTGHTPLMYAIGTPTDNVELVDALINAGASDDRGHMLMYAAAKGHTKTAERLIAAGAAASDALRMVIQDNCMSDVTKAGAVKLLRSLGADASDALKMAITKNRMPETKAVRAPEWTGPWSWTAPPSAMDYTAADDDLRALRTLSLLGAKGSDALTSAVIGDKTGLSKRLILGGADVTTALINLVKDARDNADQLARKLLFIEKDTQRKHAVPSGRMMTVLMLSLAQSKKTSAMIALSKAVDVRTLVWDELLKHESIDAARAVISSLKKPEKIVNDYALERDLSTTTKFLNAGVKMFTSPGACHYWGHRTYKDRLPEVKLLIAAGVPWSALPKEHTSLSTGDAQRQLILNKQTKNRIQSSPPGKRMELLLSAAEREDVVDVALVLDKGVDRIAALQKLSQDRNLRGIRTLIKGGMSATEAFIDRVKATDMNTAQDLAKAISSLRKPVATLALIELIARDDEATARTIIPTFTDGVQALIEATLSHDRNLAKRLIALGADGPTALLNLIQTNNYETAGRLVAWGVDIHTTLMMTYREIDSIGTSIQIKAIAAVRSALIISGADSSIALLRAADSNNLFAARRLVRADVSTGEKALLQLIAMPVGTKTRATLTFLQHSGVQIDEVMMMWAEEGKTSQLKGLIASGVPTAGPLMDLCKKRDRLSAQTLISAGADYITAMRTLQISNETEAVTVLGLALTYARDRVKTAH